MTQLPSLSRREFAAHVGRSPTVIQRLVHAGKIPLDPDGKIPMPAGLIAYSRVRSVDTPAAPAPPSSSAAGTGPGPRAPAQTPAPSRSPPREHRPSGLAQNIHEAELAQKAWDARLKELKYQRESGELVSREDVAADARAACTAIRATLLALPSRVALQVEALAAGPAGPPREAAIEALIADEINLALVSLHSTRFSPDENTEPMLGSATVATQ